MILYRTWIHDKKDVLGNPYKRKIYRMLFLFGIIPLFIWIDGK